MALVVKRPGAYSLLVDAGRPHALHLGLSRGGPADVTSWKLGNALVGNFDPPNMTALEVTLHGPVLEASALHELVVFGATFDIKLLHSGGNQTTIQTGHTFMMQPGDTLHIDGCSSQAGLRAYLCIRGGFQTPLILDSQSGLEPLHGNQTLEATSSSLHRSRFILPIPWPDAAPPGMLRLLAGTHLTKTLRAELQKAQFEVRPESNRMGLRLESTITWPTRTAELVSAPVTPGTLQLPPGGQPLLLGVNAQTIGGYPRLGHVVEADLDALGQLRPKDVIRFRLVDLPEAERLAASRRKWLHDWLERIRWSG